ncbi:MAG TPA: TIGR02147 family protein [Fibrobacteria bacterium]|jgi:uncharacterized protein (TIGR02147 family)|nr:TIGR02147 family protein [Fibrobacteria bacterium]
MHPQVTSLFEFADFRKFLEAYQAKRQEQEPAFTRLRFCADLGLPNTRSFLSDVIAGRRSLTRTYVERFVRALRMDDDEARYFRVMVDLNQCTHDKEREHLFEQLVALNRTPRKFVRPEQYEFYRHWHHTAVFASLQLRPFAGDYEGLAKGLFPAITPRQARTSVTLLEKLGLIRREGEVWKAVDRTLDTGRNVREELVRQYQLQCLELAKKILMLGPDAKTLRTFSTVTLSVSKDGSALIARKLQKFKAEVSAIAHREEAPADRIYQLNIQYYPQSNPEVLT